MRSRGAYSTRGRKEEALTEAHMSTAHLRGGIAVGKVDVVLDISATEVVKRSRCIVLGKFTFYLQIGKEANATPGAQQEGALQGSN